MAKLDDLIQQKQQRDEDWKAKKTAEREELGQLSDDAVMRVTSEPGAYLHYLDTQAINPRYSASNVMLAMAQNPDITYINSLEVWNRLGRSVNRDENGMKIRVSDTYVKDGREYHGYKIGRVFDVTQTHGKAGVPALSLKDNTPEMDAALRRLLDSSPVPVVTSSTMYQDAVYDPKTQSISQTVVINPNDTQTLYFYNTPVGGLQIIKSDKDSGKRISGVKFEIRKMNGEIIDTYTTDSDGVIYLPKAESGWYTVTELEAASGYLLDTTPHRIEVKDGQTATLEIINHKSSRILLHKVDKATGKGIYGAVFLLYDSNHNPIGEYVTNQDGYIYADEGLADGRYYLREIKAALGYVLDPELKTIYVRYGSTTEIEWSNTAECGQIQIIKKSADDNATNGLPAGTLLEGAVFEIYDKAGNVVDTIKSDRNGRAVSKTLPLSRYTIREIKAPANYSINPTVMTAYLEFNGQIVTFEVQNTSVSTGVSIKKTGPVQAVPGQPIRYVFSQIKNSSNVALDSFYWRDQLPAQVTLSKIVTGSYNQPLSYKVVYKTNLSGDYRTLADNLSTSKVYVLDARPAVLGLAANERVTEVMFVFGNVKAGFAQVETPYIYAAARSGLANNSGIVNVADVGGLYNGQWIQAVSRWLTTVYTKTTVKLPKTGY